MRLPLLTALLVLGSAWVTLAAAPIVSAPIVPANPEAAGQELAARLRALRPGENFTNSATLRMYERRKLVSEQPLLIQVRANPEDWSTTYLLNPAEETNQIKLRVVHDVDGRTQYHLRLNHGGSALQSSPAGAGLMVAFANSDFWLADLGMEFLQWPTQLESLAPAGETNGYVRVVAWFDIDTGGPVLVEAYDSAGKLVKEFKPNDFKKVDGQWQVEEVEISSPRSRTRSTIRFDLTGN